MQIQNGTGPGVRRSKRPLLTSRIRCNMTPSMEYVFRMNNSIRSWSPETRLNRHMYGVFISNICSFICQGSISSNQTYVSSWKACPSTCWTGLVLTIPFTSFPATCLSSLICTSFQAFSATSWLFNFITSEPLLFSLCHTLSWLIPDCAWSFSLARRVLEMSSWSILSLEDANKLTSTVVRLWCIPSCFLE